MLQAYALKPAVVFFKNVKITSNRGFSDHSPSWGRIGFITINELSLGGHIVNNEIKIQVRLQAGESALSNFLYDFKEVAWPAANRTLLSSETRLELD